MSHPGRIPRQLSAYLDGELAPAEMTEVGDHLAGCAACQASLEDLRAAKRLLGALPAPDLPQGFADAVWARAGRRSYRRSGRPWVWWPRPAVALAAVALALVLVAVPVVRGHRDRLRAAETGPDLFLRTAVQAAARDPLLDRAYIGLLFTDAALRLAGEDPRRPGR